MVQGFCVRGQKWVCSEVERISQRLEKYKTGYNGYNRIQPILMSKTVTSMLNNSIPPPPNKNRTIQEPSADEQEIQTTRFRRHCSTRIT